MQHDPHRPFKNAPRAHPRKEWGRDADRDRQTQAREHARLGGRARRSHGILEEEAARQIRELRGRY